MNHKSSSLLEKLKRIDWIGMTLFLGATTGFLIPITWGGVQYPWDSWRTLVPMIVCAVVLVVFVLHQEYIASEPLIRTSVFKNRTAAIAYASSVVHGIILWAILYYLPLYFQAVKGMSPIMSGVAVFPWTFTVAPAAGVSLRPSYYAAQTLTPTRSPASSLQKQATTATPRGADGSSPPSETGSSST